MKIKAAAAPTARLYLKAKLFQESIKEGTLTWHEHIVNHLLEINATEEIIAEVDTEIVCSIQPSNMLPLQYAGDL